jgi:hypothetical protein
MAPLDLSLGAARPTGPEIPVRPGVVSDLMPLVNDPAHEVGSPCGALSDQEKRSGRAGLLEEVEELRRVDGVRAIVKREGHAAMGAGTAPDRAKGQEMSTPGVGGPEGWRD